jgi:beta-glucosidase
VPLSERSWLNASAPIPQRVAALLAAMTLEEKIAQLSYDCSSSLNYSQDPWAATSLGSIGIECSSFPSPETFTVADRIARLRDYQLGALNTSRLGVPITFVVETSHCGAAGGTVFPMGISQGASWDVALVAEVAAAIALEARSWGASRGLSPEINVATDPRWGRSEENYGSDALLVAQMASAAVQALQGGASAPSDYLASPGSSIVAEAKHCCACECGPPICILSVQRLFGARPSLTPSHIPPSLTSLPLSLRWLLWPGRWRCQCG